MTITVVPASFPNPTTTAGDTLYTVTSALPGVIARLPIGTSGQVLTVVSGLPAWTTPASTSVNPMTTAQDLIVGGVAGAEGRLAVGSNGQILTVTAGVVGWAAAPTSGFANPMTTQDDLVIGGASGVAARLAKGANGTFLGIDATSGHLAYANPGTVIQGGASTKVQLDWLNAADIGLTLAANTWTDVATQTFTVDDAASIVEVFVEMGALISTSAVDVVSQVTIDGANAKWISSNSTNTGGASGLPGGWAYYSGLSAGSHTLKLQVRSDTASTAFNIRTVTTPNREFLRLGVLERKTTMNTSAAPVSGARLTQVTTGTSLPSATFTALSFDTASFDTDSLKGTGVAPWSNLTVTKAGKYLIGARVSMGSGTATDGAFNIKVNGTVCAYDEHNFSSGSETSARREVSTVMDLKVGDVITVEAYQNSGGTVTTTANGNQTQLYAISLGGIVSGTAQSKVQLDYTYSGADQSTSVSATAWTDIIPNQTFIVDDANSTVEVSVGGLLLANAAGTSEWGTQLVFDSAGANTQKQVSGSLSTGTGYTNILSGASVVTITGLSAGSHTVKLRAKSEQAGTVYLRPTTAEIGYESFQMRVIERKLVPASPSFANVNKVQLDYNASAADIANNQSVAAGSWTTPSGWTDQTFTVDDPNSVVSIAFIGAVKIGGGVASDVSGSVVLDPAGVNTRYLLGGGYLGSGNPSMNIIAGGCPIELTGLTVGTHTLRLQVRSATGTQSLYCRSNTSPDQESLRLKVIERKVVNTGTGGTLDTVRVTHSSPPALSAATETALLFDTNDTTFTSNAAMHSTSSNTSRLVAQTPGRYRVWGALATASVPSTCYLFIRKNGSGTFNAGYGNILLPSPPGQGLLGLTGEVYLAAGDYVELIAYVANAGTPTSQVFGMDRIDGYAINAKTTLGDMEYGGTGGVPTRIPGGGANQPLVTNASGVPGFGNGLLTASNKLGSNVLVTAINTFFDGPSVSLAAGTWLITGTVSWYGGTSGGHQFTIKLWDGTTAYASTETTAISGARGNASVTAIVVLGSTTTLKISGANDTNTNGYFLAATLENASGNNASQINAVKIA